MVSSWYCEVPGHWPVPGAGLGSHACYIIWVSMSGRKCYYIRLLSRASSEGFKL